ncbi:hypothetical protein AAAV48_00005, partial [Agathobaculum butyriciproducens]
MEIKHIGGLNICRLPPKVNQFRQIAELCKARFRAVTGSLGNEFVKMISLIFLNLTNRLKRNLL